MLTSLILQQGPSDKTINNLIYDVRLYNRQIVNYVLLGGINKCKYL